MKERKRSLEMRVLTIICLIAVGIGGSALLGLATKWDQVAYASSQQVWSKASLNQVSEIPSRLRVIEPASTSLASSTVDKQAAAIDKDALNRIEKPHTGEVSTADVKTVYLTFDDGPSADTADVLDILAKEKVQGTFFVLGQQVEKHGKLVKRIAEEGHALGNHSYNHNYKELYSSFSTFWSQVRKTGAAIEKIVGYEPLLVRAPGGTFSNFNKQYFDLMKQAGYLVHDWNVDTGDSKRVGVPAKEIIDGVKQGVLGNQVIVLMHDGVGHKETVKALPSIIQYYKDKGYTFKVITEDMEPMQFRVATKERWSRAPVSKTWIEEHVAAVQMDRGTPVKPVEQPVKKPDPMQFTVTTDVGEFTFDPEQYAMEQDTTYVQIRSFVEQLGGSISYDAESASYGLQFNGSNWVVDRMTGQMSRLGEDGVIEQLEWKALKQHNAFFVPLRSLLEDSGAHLLSYELKPVKVEEPILSDQTGK